jgi:SAM-dependent methyltransferase
MQHQIHKPSPWVVRYAQLVAPGASLIDVACGYGRHARFFAARGALVTAVDYNSEALLTLRGIENLTTELHDLENDRWPYREQSFDAVIVCNYLWRPTFDALLAMVKVGGVLIYETFMTGNERYGKPSRPDFLLQSNELIDRVVKAFRVVAFEEGEARNELGSVFAMTQAICAVRLI